MAEDTPRKTKGRATDPLVRCRVDELIPLRLEGKFPHEICRYVSEREALPGNCWSLADGESPMSSRQVQRYISAADKELLKLAAGKREQHLKRHLAQRRYLYARATQAGELRTALAVLDSEAELLGLHPEGRGDDGKAPAVVQFISVPVSVAQQPAPAALPEPSFVEVPDGRPAAG